MPTIQRPTQTEVTSGAAGGNTYRRPDSETPENPRIYETAGMLHANRRDTVAYTPGMCTLPVSDFP